MQFKQVTGMVNQESLRNCNCMIYDVLFACHFRGKFGEVMRCAEKSTGEVFAAKFIPTPTPQDKEEVKNEVSSEIKIRSFI